MRIVVAFCVLIGFAGHAVAADYRALQRRDHLPPPPVADTLTSPPIGPPVLRGANVFEPREPEFVRWDGFYVGGQFAYGFASADFGPATRSLVAHALRETALEQERQVSNWRVLGEATRSGSGFGGFAGYNGQWQDAIVGVELNYTRMSLNLVAPNSPITRATTAGGNSYVVSLSGAGSLNITDLVTLRGRAGWAFGPWMPYATVGLAVGRADMSRSVRIDLTENLVPFTFVSSGNRNGALMYGVGLGLGVEWSLMGNIFLRGEYEYLAFMPVGGIAPHAHIGRAGFGLRF